VKLSRGCETAGSSDYQATYRGWEDLAHVFDVMGETYLVADDAVAVGCVGCVGYAGCAEEVEEDNFRTAVRGHRVVTGAEV